jgi:LacI family transcriptional regulator
MTRHLIGLGHRDIAMLAGPEHLPSARDRVQAYRAAMLEAGLEPRARHCSYHAEDAVESIKDLLSVKPRCSALFAAAGDLVTAALVSAAEFGLKIPDDLALVSFDDHPLYEHFSPALTAVSQPIHDLGQAAVDLLFPLMDGAEPDEKSRILPTKIVIRESCGFRRQKDGAREA